MEPWFINKTLVTQEMANEAAKLHYRKSHTLVRVIYLALSIYLILALLGIRSLTPSVFIISALIISCLFMFFAGHLTYSRRLYASIIAQNPTGEEGYSFYDDKMENNSPNANRWDEYSKIKQVIISKKLYLLMLNKDTFFIIDKNGFLKGNNELFDRFIVAQFNGRIFRK